MSQYRKETMLKDNDSIQIGHNISYDWSMNQYHFHDSYEINLAVSGGNRFFINDEVYDVKKGDLFLFNHKDLHKTMIEENIKYERYLIFFDPAILSGISTDNTNLLKLFNDRTANFTHLRRLKPEQCIELTALFEELIYYQKNPVYGRDIYMKLKLVEILLMIHGYYHLVEITASDITSPNYIKVKEILTYINNHISEKILLDDMAKQFYINKYYLCELFKKTTGFTINQYITNKRILKSRELLKSGYSVTHVAELIGYQNDSHFIRTFKKLVGITPKQYAIKYDINDKTINPH